MAWGLRSTGLGGTACVRRSTDVWCDIRPLARVTGRTLPTIYLSFVPRATAVGVLNATVTVEATGFATVSIIPGWDVICYRLVGYEVGISQISLDQIHEWHPSCRVVSSTTFFASLPQQRGKFFSLNRWRGYQWDFFFKTVSSSFGILSLSLALFLPLSNKQTASQP